MENAKERFGIQLLFLRLFYYHYHYYYYYYYLGKEISFFFVFSHAFLTVLYTTVESEEQLTQN